MVGSPRTWAEIVRRSKRKAKKASGRQSSLSSSGLGSSSSSRQSSRHNSGAGKAAGGPKILRLQEFPTLTENDLDHVGFDPVELPKTRSLKKRSDKAIASAARFSITKRSGSFLGRGSSSQKKRQKTKAKLGSKKTMMTTDIIVDDHDSGVNDDSVSLSSICYEPQGPVTMADFLPFSNDLTTNNPAVSVAESPPKISSSRWPITPKLNFDSFLKMSNPLWRNQHNYESLISFAPADVHSKTKVPRTLRGLVDLDLVDPCTPMNPCLLDRLSLADQVCMACFHSSK